MKLFKSEIFGHIPEPDSVQTLFEIINNSCRDNSTRVRIWRGQADVSWPIHSAAYRRIEKDNIRLNEGEMRSYERRLLDEATHRRFRYFEGHTLSDFELLARLQHHGAATRLVDASKSALVALWFAVSERQKTTGALVGVHSHHIGGGEGETEIRPYEEVVKQCEDLGHPMTWEPSGVSPRIAAQHAQFLYSSMSTDVTGSLKLSNNEDATLVVAISPKMKKECVELLSEVYDIRLLTLFPDIDGFSRANGTQYTQWENYRW